LTKRQAKDKIKEQELAKIFYNGDAMKITRDSYIQKLIDRKTME